jgi:hypothetical protein
MPGFVLEILVARYPTTHRSELLLVGRIWTVLDGAAGRLTATEVSGVPFVVKLRDAEDRVKDGRELTSLTAPFRPKLAMEKTLAPDECSSARVPSCAR